MGDNVAIARNKFRIHNELVRCLLAEFISTGLLLFAGTSTNAANLLGGGDLNKIGVIIGWGLAIGTGVFAAARISGAHMNPSISFAVYLCGKLPAYKFILYSIAQLFGAFMGSVVTFLLYYDGINHFDGGERQTIGTKATIGIFVPWPQEYMTVSGCIFDQFIGTAFLAFCIMMMTDPRNKVPVMAQPLILALVIVLIGIALSQNAGAEINPARDLGPKLMALVVGYGWNVVSYQNYKWFPIPIFVPFIGAAFGAWFYHLTIGIHISEDEGNRRIFKVDDRMEMDDVSRVTMGKSKISIAR
uniref:Aquaporin n=1 Tax=Setaria digitata TaxID=48799 RepID=A0A915PSA7_9BILA